MWYTNVCGVVTFPLNAGVWYSLVGLHVKDTTSYARSDTDTRNLGRHKYQLMLQVTNSNREGT